MFNFSSRRLFAPSAHSFSSFAHLLHSFRDYTYGTSQRSLFLHAFFFLLFQVNGDLLQPICRRCAIGEFYDLDSFFLYFTFYNFRIHV